ncbi:DUF6884 domain-containing protein [Thermoproteus tenax]|uniref:DUF6884 domain-containing protein n=1 Tax=Thermoproteus tenax (strain ATCC 35583 / DSM 2078 / JCM 9277 / NBRC 100435 / Kra 1) TaxID=768679 RepID=G4RMH3_THETK|nr:DUF6884 domain-containing protein [Thermoproteus tenax]CCC80804.1 hypothetical protein TTX_0127 [Thermoproteus tenax Kra 1]
MPLVSIEDITAEQLRERFKSRDLLILAHCTKRKKVDWSSVVEALKVRGLGVPGFDLERENTYREALQSFIKPAVEMYGGSFAQVRSIFYRVRQCARAELFIVSARYGLIRWDEPIIPYEATLNALRRDELARWSLERGVPERTQALLKRFGAVLAILPESYARALGPALDELLSLESVLAVIPASLTDGTERALVVPRRGRYLRREEALKLSGLLAEALCR